jgi:hypothetical protein
LNADELSIEILNSIKEAFKDKTIDIIISVAIDETDYLFSSDTNKKQLAKSMKEIEEGNCVVLTVEALQKKYKT